MNSNKIKIIRNLFNTLSFRNIRFVLMFHGISTLKHPDIPINVQPYLCQAELRFILSWLQRRFDFLAPQAFLDSHDPGVLLTFDDGLANNLDHALPVLSEFSAPALFFVSTQHVLNPRDWLPAARQTATLGWGSEAQVPAALAAEFFDGLSPEQLKACAAHPLITIGSHTISHPFLTRCSPDEVREELVESRQVLEQITGRVVDLFAYPTGDYDQSVAEAVRQAGYRAAFAVDSRKAGLPSYEIPRIGLYEARPAYLSLKLSGLHRRPLPARPLIP